jgi:acyl-CoA dehydrogenase
MWDAIAAKGFEKDTYFEMATRDIRALPKLEGTVHVNIALVNKFIQNFLFNPKSYDQVGVRNEPQHDRFLFDQGAAGGLGKIQFHDYNLAYNLYKLPNVEIFKQQIQNFKQLLLKGAITPEQHQDTDLALSVGELFTIIAYGQLILENAQLHQVPELVIDQIFSLFVRDFSELAYKLYTRATVSPLQQELCLKLIARQHVDMTALHELWQNHVSVLADQYTMNP